MLARRMPYHNKANSSGLFSLATPDPGRPIMIHEIYESTVCIKTRQEDTKITTPLQLAASEIDCLVKHLMNYFNSDPDNHDACKYLRYGNLQFYLFTIFKQDWDSDKHPGPMPFLLDQDFNDCIVEVGTFKHDLAPNPGQSYLPFARRKDAKAHFMLSINQEDKTVVSHWKDEEGGDAKAEDVAMFDWMTKELANSNAINAYDSWERIRVESYNWELCVYAGRKQIMEFAKVGIQPDQWRKPKIIPSQKLVLMRRHIREMVNFWHEAATAHIGHDTM
ncbi:hypothetical protein FSARC_4262 [Fusarium sarcochroum]|uniref:Uncharacterized protein n=1 Tax=Fusarium sarcochroum TaxID=1208366 RepID=A0A8H4U291_9HYPO|nr:hypothetical protein FSARC_4262 [Fusarium sarcochroum]